MKYLLGLGVILIASIIDVVALGNYSPSTFGLGVAAGVVAAGIMHRPWRRAEP